jgi:antitoxin component of RelBE/YafQ-DinJ toxin-antitoxin module
MTGEILPKNLKRQEIKMSKAEQQLTMVIDGAMKERAKIALRANGISIKEAVNDLLRRTAKNQEIPFRINRSPKLHNAGITETMRRFFEIDEGWPPAPEGNVNMCMHLDGETLAAAQQKLEDYGVPGTAIIRAFLTQCAYEMRLPY